MVYNGYMKHVAIILAGGLSTRLGKNAGDKLFLPLMGKPLLYFSLAAFHNHPDIDEVFIVAHQKNIKKIAAMVQKYHFPKVAQVVVGGNMRQDSVYNGLCSVKASPKDIVMIHNGANPLVEFDEISAVIQAVKKYGAAAVGHRMVDTVKEKRKHVFVKTLDRDLLVAMQTPQAAYYATFMKAFAQAKKQKRYFTDDAALIENIGKPVAFVPASPHNFKVTTLADYDRIKAIMGDVPATMLVGLGQDSHTFSASEKGLTLGGVFLKKERKLEADSDGDVVLHALCNALSQALGEGSLGLFATPLLKEKNIKDSAQYLSHALERIRKKKYALNNIGVMIEAKSPRIDGLVPRLKKSLGKLTNLPELRIGITATSGDNLTSFGRGEGIQCFVIVSLVKEVM